MRLVIICITNMIIYELDRTNLQVRENNDRLRLYFIIVLVNVYYDYILFDIRATYDQCSTRMTKLLFLAR